MELLTHSSILHLILLPLLTLAGAMSSGSHCRRYRACLLSARSDYELCLGGMAAAIVGDYANIKDINKLLKHSVVVAECENKNFDKIIEYKAIKRIEEDDILHCTEETQSGNISEMRKLACLGTPVTWSLQDLARVVVKRPSECRELYVYQMERCTFLGSCCPEIHTCTLNITESSLAYQQRIQRGQEINTVTRKCLETTTEKYEALKKSKNETTSKSSLPNFHLSNETQKQRINDAIEKARAEIGSKQNTTNPEINVKKENRNNSNIPTTTTPAFPTLPTLPTLPNLLHILFPSLTTPIPTSSTTTPAPTSKATKTYEKEITKPVNTEFAKDADAEVYEEKERLTEDENKKICHEALRCESQLRSYKLKCGKKHIDELKVPISHAGYSDLVILRELLDNADDTDIAPAVRKSCIHSLLQNYTGELTGLLNEMDKKHKICTKKSTFFRKTIKTNEKQKCMAISTSMIFEEIAFNEEDENVVNKSQNESYDSCLTKIKFATKKCDEAKKCCPGYNVCTKLMMESETHQKYSTKINQVKEQQRKCETDTISSLSSVQPGFAPYFH